MALNNNEIAFGNGLSIGLAGVGGAAAAAIGIGGVPGFILCVALVGLVGYTMDNPSIFGRSKPASYFTGLASGTALALTLAYNVVANQAEPSGFFFDRMKPVTEQQNPCAALFGETAVYHSASGSGLKVG